MFVGVHDARLDSMEFVGVHVARLDSMKCGARLSHGNMPLVLVPASRDCCSDN